MPPVYIKFGEFIMPGFLRPKRPILCWVGR